MQMCTDAMSSARHGAAPVTPAGPCESMSTGPAKLRSRRRRIEGASRNMITDLRSGERGVVAAARPLGGIAVTPRHLADYRIMFLRTDEELRSGRMLDCPAGASPFGAQVRARGGTVVSVDPAYRAGR